MVATTRKQTELALVRFMGDAYLVTLVVERHAPQFGTSRPETCSRVWFCVDYSQDDFRRRAGQRKAGLRLLCIAGSFLLPTRKLPAASGSLAQRGFRLGKALCGHLKGAFWTHKDGPALSRHSRTRELPCGNICARRETHVVPKSRNPRRQRAC